MDAKWTPVNQQIPAEGQWIAAWYMRDCFIRGVVEKYGPACSILGGYGWHLICWMPIPEPPEPLDSLVDMTTMGG